MILLISMNLIDIADIEKFVGVEMNIDQRFTQERCFDNNIVEMIQLNT